MSRTVGAAGPEYDRSASGLHGVTGALVSKPGCYLGEGLLPVEGGLYGEDVFGAVSWSSGDRGQAHMVDLHGGPTTTRHPAARGRLRSRVGSAKVAARPSKPTSRLRFQ